MDLMANSKTLPHTRLPHLRMVPLPVLFVRIGSTNRSDLKEFRERLIFVDDAIVAFQNLAHGIYLEWN